MLAALADLQHGVVGRDQLLALGLTRQQIRSRLGSGLLHLVRPGVYAVGRRQLTPAGNRAAAVLAAGAGARLAGWSAATHRGVLPEAGRRIDIAVPPQRRVALPGIHARRTIARPGDVEVVDGVRVHAVARMLLDIAAVNDEQTLEWAWRQSIFHGLLDVAEVAQVLGDFDGAPGTPVLRALYERRAVLVGQLRNRFEVRMLSIIREAGLPEPLCNEEFEVAPGIVLHPDFRIPQLLLVVEGDGRDGHADVEFMFTDEQRDGFYARHRYATLRYSAWSAWRERARIVGELRAFAAARWKRGLAWQA